MGAQRFWTKHAEETGIGQNARGGARVLADACRGGGYRAERMLRRRVSGRTHAVEQGFWLMRAEAGGIGRNLCSGARVLADACRGEGYRAESMLRRGVSGRIHAVGQGFWPIHAEAEGIGRNPCSEARVLSQPMRRRGVSGRIHAVAQGFWLTDA